MIPPAVAVRSIPEPSPGAELDVRATAALDYMPGFIVGDDCEPVDREGRFHASVTLLPVGQPEGAAAPTAARVWFRTGDSAWTDTLKAREQEPPAGRDSNHAPLGNWSAYFSTRNAPEWVTPGVDTLEVTVRVQLVGDSLPRVVRRRLPLQVTQ